MNSNVVNPSFSIPLFINLTKTVCFYIIQTNCSEGILLAGSNTLDKAQIEKSVLYPAFFVFWEVKIK